MQTRISLSEQVPPKSASHSFFQNCEARQKKSGLSKYLNKSLFSWKSKENENVISAASKFEENTYVVPPSSTGWKLFAKSVPTINSPLPGTSRNEISAKISHPSLPNLSGDCVANSTTALILENRPANLPAKSVEEAHKHKQEYDNMVDAAKRKVNLTPFLLALLELKEAKQRKKQLQQQLKQEEALSNASKIWNNDIVPHWENMKSTKKVRELWWQGIPPNVRGKVWKLAIGNHLNVTAELYEICVNRARDRISLAVESASICSEDADTADSSPDKESSVDLIKLDVSRTFPQFCIFQKGGPYYDILHSILGAYVCYRPDVGYVQGMSFIAAILILNLDVADAFICFSNLLNKPCQMAFFRLDAPVMKAYFMTYEEFFRENLLKLCQHFDKQKLTSDLYLVDWIYTLFSKSVPLDVACRVWDVCFRDGEEFIFRAALGILNLYQDVLLGMEFIHLGQFLKKLPEDLSSESLFKSIDVIRMVTDKKKFNQIFTLHCTEIK
ncbi:TBC1 domain family member 14 [Nymphon striatum]|nr:TBC1 domain family member 14 [Nymphon striatum]